MPIHESPDPAVPEWTKEVKSDYLVFYSSRDQNGNLWCPDCRRIESWVQDAFGPADKPPATIVYVGQRAEWKTPSNPFRARPWEVESIPTVIRTKDGTKLFDQEISQESLASFVSA
ncbi:hypothetical protein C8Q74DRAFT_1364431 [Fomes fomentarius]|nr:hypothetical protein C8Q74DRAFT_1364431 [Fomes fomentarius]